MKTHKLLTTLSLAAMLLTPAYSQTKPATATPSPAAYYQAGVKAMDQGDIVKAEQYLNAAHAARHPHAAYQLGQLKLNRASIIAKKRELTLKSIKIDQVDYEDATISDCLEHLTHKMKQANKDFTPNFVVRDTKDSFKSKLITLELNNVPAGVVLEQILSMASAKAEYSEHTVIIKPL